MENLDLKQMLQEAIDWNLLESVVRMKLEDSIDYEKIAEELLEGFDITEAVLEMMIPF